MNDLIPIITSLGPDGLLALACYFLWKAYQGEVLYNKEQDKANLKTIDEITRVLDKIMDATKEGSSLTQEKVKEVYSLLETRSADILRHLDNGPVSK